MPTRQALGAAPRTTPSGNKVIEHLTSYKCPDAAIDTACGLQEKKGVAGFVADADGRNASIRYHVPMDL